ncbi:bifunctional biotin--[acetyl-CoA-carboxylase] ligase/biotin operon repressor BirA [Aestuariirhabdus sp. Z084]|uniref:bifunctional biotin--[acetyl-CoA-carboxylase] ligase/biotin operon repressor BirA n=1 Tax=Aestuariirhabdus haliotis TaxID=2918751 RepID=UPI00201B3A70|nr:bifunctional biotin--[acetyl-CoA-carboxylase] ligase/biotin operon repressor BirA [Aestuariirhabdus haliotis]MCL6417799.1 bifunctional biotin--[acetyl-CoA-carboxylase] ligase/biotin operon repressor BirA [Aestuariirhabdus haliotis]MCL6421724.1 bifunctional biotin--[acetyl-CoA-carboxylase] ligase/biotin operon repressor BirA [Aestuariirhabdus haliotis]
MDLLLDILRDGQFHSGDAIGERLGVGRAAVWKQLKRLQDLGLDLDSVKGRGYRLAPGTELLDRGHITRALDDGLMPIKLDLFSTLDSTNEYVLAQECAAKGYFCMSEHQSAGRGRRGRQWCSPFGANLYLSCLWEFAEGVAALEGLSLAVGLAVQRAIARETGSYMHLKWPNDLLWQGRKLAGILLEISGDPAGECRVVIGVGVNFRLTKAQRDLVDQPCADLSELPGKLPSKNRFAASLISELLRVLSSFERHGFKPFMDEWSQYDAFKGQVISVQVGSGQWCEGVSHGVDQHGALQVDTDKGLISYRGGEVSLRGSADDT